MHVLEDIDRTLRIQMAHPATIKQHHKQACKLIQANPGYSRCGDGGARPGTLNHPNIQHETASYPDNAHFGLFSHLTKHRKNWKPQGKGCSRLPGTQKRPTAAIQKRQKTTPLPGGQETFATPSKAPVQT